MARCHGGANPRPRPAAGPRGRVRGGGAPSSHRAPVRTRPRAPPLAEIRSRIARLVDHEEELLVDPRFFAAVAARSPRAARVEALVKRGDADNELTRFRYDVVLHVGGPAGASPAGPGPASGRAEE